jgi:hypothetical protein
MNEAKKAFNKIIDGISGKVSAEDKELSKSIDIIKHRERIIQNALIHYINDKVEGGLDWDL